MTNVRDEWQQDMAKAAGQSFFTATVTAVNGDGTVTFKRYPDAAAETQPKLASYTSPQVGDIVAVQALGSGWLVTGLVTPIYQPIAVVSALPTASATYRGVPLRTAGATGVADGVYVCTKDASDAYSWVQVGNLAVTPTNSYISSDISLSAFAAENVTSLTLGAGYWMLIGTLVFTTTGTFYAWLSSSHASTTGIFAEAHSQASGGNPACITVVSYRIGPGTYYLNAEANASGAVKATGGVSAAANGLITNLQAFPI